MAKHIHNAWKRFLVLDRQIARTASVHADSSLDERQSVKSMPDYAAIKAHADSGARGAGF